VTPARRPASSPVRHIDDDERRARLARRHGLSPEHRAADPVAATRALTVLHATEPASVHLALWARVAGLALADVDRALYDDRSIVKQLAMRRTLFGFPRELLPAAWGSVSARVAVTERAHVTRDLLAGGITAHPDAWLANATQAVLKRLADGVERTAQQLRAELPELAGSVALNVGKSYGGTFHFAPRVLTMLGAEARIVRGHNAGHWRLSKPMWTTMDAWLGDVPNPLTPEAGYRELVRRWLGTFGPGTVEDIQWWLGSTKGAVRQALAEIEAVAVSLDGGLSGWVLPDDVDPMPAVGPWAALLPALDPTVMGWKERGFYLGPHRPLLFDTAGNAGTTAWWDGRIVGCWIQDPAGRVHVSLLEEVGRAARRAVDAEAGRLTAWLDGVRAHTVYASPAMEAARARL
jgi:hypothetical protein